MMLTCAKCGRQHPLSDEDLAFFHPRFFCLSCGEKLPFEGVAESKLAELRHSNDRQVLLSAADLKGLPPLDQPRRIKRGADGASADSGG